MRKHFCPSELLDSCSMLLQANNKNVEVDEVMLGQMFFFSFDGFE